MPTYPMIFMEYRRW